MTSSGTTTKMSTHEIAYVLRVVAGTGPGRWRSDRRLASGDVGWAVMKAKGSNQAVTWLEYRQIRGGS
jgi:hypothetical protein